MFYKKSFRKKLILCSGAIVFFLFSIIELKAQPGGRRQQPIVLAADDTAAFAQPPAGYDQQRKNIERGKTEAVQYESKTVGSIRNLLVYTPPGYSKEKKYPVLYLLHGIGGTEKEWYKYAEPNVILDNLLADKKMVPMIVVFPNGRAMKNDSDTGNVFSREKMEAFATFEKDLLNDVIPFIESKYSVVNGNINRAVAGFSMGGGQSLNFGLSNPDVFSWVGGFSSAPNTKKPEDLVPNAAAITNKIKLLYVACGDKDGLIYISQGLHRHLTTLKFPHIYHIQPGEHNIDPWKKDLYHFPQLIFR